MQYLISEMLESRTTQAGDAKVFKTIKDALQFIREKNKNTRILLGEQEASVDQLRGVLKERLATVTLVLENEPDRSLLITTF